MVKSRNGISRYLRTVLKKVLIFITTIPFINYLLGEIYINFVKLLNKYKKYSLSKKILNKGITFFPRHKKVNEYYLQILIHNRDFNKAYKHFLKVNDRFIYLSERIINDLVKSLIKSNHIELAERLIELGLTKYSNSPNILIQKTEILIMKKDYDSAEEILTKIRESINEKLSIKYYLLFTSIYSKTQRYTDAVKILKNTLHEYPENIKVQRKLYKLLILNGEWQEVKDTIESMYKINPNKLNDEDYTALLLSFKILGLPIDQLDKMKIKLNLEKKYTKLKLFDNGESIIEFYKLSENTKNVCLTFDSINLTIKDQPFAFKFLIKKNLDIIAVRKRKKVSYFQDLSKEDFYNTVSKIVNLYQRKIAYGFSIGGYAALYYGSTLNCEIISLAPRNSTHPLYGKQIDNEKYPFLHELKMPMNNKISPIIVYDPKNLIDNLYVEKELKECFPKGRFIEFAYAGHRVAPFLQQVGILKDLVERALNNEKIPIYKNLPKHNSAQYLRILGNECYKRNKFNWALSLGTRAVELVPQDPNANILKIKTLIKLGKLYEALGCASKALFLIPDDDTIKRLFLFSFVRTESKCLLFQKPINIGLRINRII